MTATLSAVFIALSGASLLWVLWALWRSLSALLSTSVAVSAAPASAVERDALLGEKRALLQTLRDLEFERETGKLSEGDFATLNRRYRSRTKEVMRELDKQLSGYRQQAAELIAAELTRIDSATTSEQVGSAQGGEEAESGAVGPESNTTRAVEQDLMPCPKCNSDNDVDAVFCKKCGERFEGAEGAS